MFIESKYRHWYYKIIERATQRANRRLSANQILGYSERHHIIPKCMGGGNNKENLVYLSAREHFICHLLLIRFVEKEYIRKMKFALGKFIQNCKLQDRKFTSRQYDIIRKSISEARTGFRHTEETIKKISEGHKGQIPWNKGLSLPSITEEHKEILSLLYKSRTFEERFGEKSEDIKRKISESKIGKSSGMLGKIHSDETKDKMKKSKPDGFGEKVSKSRIGMQFSEEHMENLKKANIENGLKRRGIRRIKLVCPHCGKEGGNSQMKRYHFDKCKVQY